MRFLLLLLLLGGGVSAVVAQTASASDQSSFRRDAEIRELRAELEGISARLARLEAADPGVAGSGAAGSGAAGSGAAATQPVVSAEDRATLDFFRGTTVSFGVGGYYGYNFNQPVGRVNLLRAYDVSSNSFSINQASVVVEHLPTEAERFGGRVDLQFGQATETLQGSAANEQRPQVWRNLFQAYGSYLAPLGTGLQVDFGKWASSLGVEGSYTKDQMNYSRSYLFNFLPFYHTGVRANYNVTPKVNVAYWLVNGAQQTEDFNGSKSQAFATTLKPTTTLTWNVNYYFGREQRDVLPTLNPGAPTMPTQPGLPTTNISPAPNGREHIFDSYATWKVTPRLTLAGEGDYVVERVLSESAPAHVSGGAAYARYQMPRRWAVAGRAEYLSDRGGLFSGTTQALKEMTFTVEHQFATGFLTRAEWRRDFSNRRFFLTDEAGVLSHAQSTAMVGLVYWWGTKQGSW